MVLVLVLVLEPMRIPKIPATYIRRCHQLMRRNETR